MAAFGAIVSFLTLARFVHTVVRGIDAGAMRDEFDLGQRMSLASHHRPGSGIACSTTSTFRGRRLLRFPPTALPRSIHPKSDLPHTARPARPNHRQTHVRHSTIPFVPYLRSNLLRHRRRPLVPPSVPFLLCILSYSNHMPPSPTTALFPYSCARPPLPYRDSAQFPPHPHHPL